MATHEKPPDLFALDDGQRHRVGQELTRRGARCGGCGSTDFDIGAGLYLGFLFHSEPTDSYLVALTCTNAECPAPARGSPCAVTRSCTAADPRRQ